MIICINRLEGTETENTGYKDGGIVGPELCLEGEADESSNLPDQWS